MATLLTEALKGAHAELLEANGPLERLRRIGALTGILAGEVVHAASLTPLGLRAARVRRCVHVLQRSGTVYVVVQRCIVARTAVT